MNTHRIIRRTVLVAALALIAWLPALSTQAAEISPGGGIPDFMGAQPSSDHSAPTLAGGTGETASGAVEDTLQACLARIPTDASAGQRMIAEDSCKRDEGTRGVIQAVPGF